MNKPSKSRFHGRRAFGRTIALVAACLVVAPAAALAAAPRQTTFSYKVPVKATMLAHGSSVAVTGKVTSPQSNVKNWWSSNTIRSTVQKGVNNARQTPYTANGFRCTATLKGEHTNFVCTLRGADVPTTVNFRYSIVYRGDTASG